MRYRYRGRRRRTHRGTLLVLLLLTAVFLVSCVAGSSPLWVRSVFGIDTVNYDAEPVERSFDTKGDVAVMLCDTLDILLADSIELKPFHSTAQAVKNYRDAILHDMLSDNYRLYAGNSALLSTAEACYPHMLISTLIPEEDFENTVFRYFGSTNVKHQNGEMFVYLSRADSYTVPLQISEAALHVDVLSVKETAHTYRMTFTLSDEFSVSSPYIAVFVKRDDGSCYMYSLDKM